MGYELPMPVQEEVIPFLLGEDNDVIALAQTGTGKTAAFGLPILQKIDVHTYQPQALILCPTRELCLQIADDLNDYSKYIDNLKVLPVYGGSSIESQIKTLKRGVHVVVATPGRLLDLMNRKTVDLSLVKNVILDEADEMLNMGFTDSINAILAEVPASRNMLLFSATMPQGIAGITKKYMNNPKEIVIGRKNEGNKNIKHIYYMVHARDKYLALKRIADFYPNIYGIIFCRTRKETQEIADKLIQDGYNADSLHGELSQAQRDYVMQKFRVKNIQLLVATDVAARGLDVDDLTHVINYGLPDEIESYTHRSGRTGRAGKTGISIAICHVKEKGKIREIERILNKKFEKGEMPSGHAICEKQLFNLVDQIEKVKVNEEEIESLMPSIFRKLEWLDKEDIIKRVVSMEFNRMIDYYKDADEIELVDERSSRGERKERGSRFGHDSEEGYSRFFLNFGKADGLFANQLIELVNKCVPGKVRIGRIDLRENFSFFEVEEKEAKRVMDSMNGFEVEGRRIFVEPAQAQKGDRGKGRSGSRSDRGGSFRGKRDGKDFGSGERRSRSSSDKPWRRSSSERDSRKKRFNR
ncbi:DEAD/DEAH box helicase [Parabacteroides bouchesdurhonensis]|uniref:DEAD/DEAH box helicase n=1 Tax=Parabacteroides bouchesdurhonensis TaxID=1936995 RepID=UPI000E470B35|nr:DEAD/DEAH box helicase [Parabacteroides bouchesdurhonensis]RHJ94252.1 ATP-dependent helicase [Bacteroides sp. AM07-16]